MIERVRVLIISNSDIGLYKLRKGIIQTLLNNNYEVFLSIPSGEHSNRFLAMGCVVDNFAIQRRGLNPINDLKLFFHYLRLVRRIIPTVVFSYTIKPNIYGGLVCKLLGVFQIANVTGLGDAVENPGLLQSLVLFLTKVALKKTNVVFFQNIGNKHLYEQLSLVRPNQTRLIPGSGVNLKKYCRLGYPKVEDNVRLVFIGRIMKDKGIGELVEAAIKVHSKYLYVTCDIVGPFEESNYRSVIESFVSSGAGKYLGLCDDIHELLNNYHAVVLPSYHEGMSNVLLEAAATGRPVLASNVPGCRETFDEGISGFGFEPRSVDSLVQAIERFIALSHEEKAEMGQAGRRKMEREFDRQIVVDAYMREIENILEENNKKEKKK
ncbi:MAG: glycosyltransferase family 4 protein [Sphaerochaeta sp.]|nr:glycosyltransferase family 4 protein [Sphaerochaeta sp.]